MIKWKEIFIGLLFLVTTINASDNQILDDESLRLAKSVIPSHYDLHLETHVHDNGRRLYHGNVKIHVDIKETVNMITLHTRGLSIETVQLKNSITQIDVPSTETYDTAKEFMHISSGESFLTINEKYSIEITYSASLGTGTSGFYRSQYRVAGENLPR